MKFAADSVCSLLTLLLSLILSSTIVACVEEKPPGYYDHSDGFSLIIPDGWHHQDNVGNASAVFWRGERDSSSPVLTVVTVPVPPEADNNRFADLNFREAASVEGYVPMRNDEVVIDGDTLPVLLYAYKDGNNWRQGMLTSIVSEGDDDDRRGYVFLGSSYSGKIEGDKVDYLRILETFKRK
ncbi:MAG: hypothetical protein KDD67_04140 [Ignavibacteriae bacterium]|nr:hypothetical protein [Ignavibacteriota bacterium]MCB9217648.1 hypothetical protein [Ignavibacteria bacterium]